MPSHRTQILTSLLILWQLALPSDAPWPHIVVDGSGARILFGQTMERRAAIITWVDRIVKRQQIAAIPMNNRTVNRHPIPDPTMEVFSCRKELASRS